jgi:Flp pilus assembly protein TadD
VQCAVQLGTGQRGANLPGVGQAEKLFEKAMALKPWDGGLYQTLGVLLHKSGRVDRARLLFKQGSHAAKDHAALWQAWALMEAEAGKVVEARALFQQGVWGAGSSPKVHALWQAWGLFEAKQGNFDDARKYLARAVDAADRPATPLLAWALVEERQGAVAVSAQVSLAPLSFTHASLPEMLGLRLDGLLWPRVVLYAA